MEKIEVHEMTEFEYNVQGFTELKNALKSGKIVRNPFARFYNDVEVNILQEEKSML